MASKLVSVWKGTCNKLWTVLIWPCFCIFNHAEVLFMDSCARFPSLVECVCWFGRIVLFFRFIGWLLDILTLVCALGIYVQQHALMWLADFTQRALIYVRPIGKVLRHASLLRKDSFCENMSWLFITLKWINHKRFCIKFYYLGRRDCFGTMDDVICFL